MEPDDDIGWDQPGPMTVIPADLLEALELLPDDPIGLCRAAQALVALPDLAPGFGIPDHRQDERSIRGAGDILRRLVDLGPTPIGLGRPDHLRVVGTCRHFAVLSCAFLRHRGIPARARCGFAAYFVPGKFVDHWVVEHLDAGRWVRVDPEILGLELVERPEDLAVGEFLTGGEAWTLLQGSGVDPGDFGVVGAPHAWGIGEVRGNALRDLAALNKVEVLPWDEWSQMEASYRGGSGPAFDALVDEVAAACASGDPARIARTYRSSDLAVPTALLA